jgi:tetratricopeptide (TPR) repeat protein
MPVPVLAIALITLSAQLPFAELNSQDSDDAYLEITAKVVLEDGSPLVSSPMVLLHQPGFESQCAGQQLFKGGTLVLRVPRGNAGCELSIMLTGYRKFTGYVHDGTLITLRRIGPGEGSSVSIASLNAPAKARKEYELGESAAAKEKWPKAEEHFKTSLFLDPQYAMAWSELGQALQKQGRFDEAKDAFQKARHEDPTYIKPVVQLAAASGVQQRWEEEMNFSEEALNMHPVEFPAAYFFHAEATFHIGKLEDAQRLTREAIELDPGGSCPESLVLLAKIFEKQGNTSEASIAYHRYLKLAPRGALAKETKEALARLKHAN